jgi:hypothetical protein
MAESKKAQAPTTETGAAAAGKEIPRYKILETSYIDDVYYDPESKPFKNDADGQKTDERVPIIIPFTGVPGPHMEPVNAAARAMFAKHNPQHVDPIGDLTIVGPRGADIKKIVDQAEGRTAG